MVPHHQFLHVLIEFHSWCRCRSCSQIVTLDQLGDVAVWSLTGGGVVTTSSSGEFVPPPLACTMTLPPICIREGHDDVPPALLELKRMFHFKHASSSVRCDAYNHSRFFYLNARSSGPLLHRLPSVIHCAGLPPKHPGTSQPNSMPSLCFDLKCSGGALRRRHHKAKLCSESSSCICGGIGGGGSLTCKFERLDNCVFAFYINSHAALLYMFVIMSRHLICI